MRVFLITFVVSVLETIFLWSLGAVQKIWPAHPILALTLIAAISGIAIQVGFSRAAARRKSHPAREG